MKMSLTAHNYNSLTEIYNQTRKNKSLYLNYTTMKLELVSSDTITRI
jgi:hypothetical protein